MNTPNRMRLSYWRPFRAWQLRYRAGPGGWLSTGRPPRSSEARAAIAARPAATANTIIRPWWNGPEISAGKGGQPAPGGQGVRPGVAAESRGKQRRQGGQGADLMGDGVGHALVPQAA